MSSDVTIDRARMVATVTGVEYALEAIPYGERVLGCRVRRSEHGGWFHHDGCFGAGFEIVDDVVAIATAW